MLSLKLQENLIKTQHQPSSTQRVCSQFLWAPSNTNLSPRAAQKSVRHNHHNPTIDNPSAAWCDNTDGEAVTGHCCVDDHRSEWRLNTTEETDSARALLSLQCSQSSTRPVTLGPALRPCCPWPASTTLPAHQPAADYKIVLILSSACSGLKWCWKIFYFEHVSLTVTTPLQDTSFSV